MRRSNKTTDPRDAPLAHADAVDGTAAVHRRSRTHADGRLAVVEAELHGAHGTVLGMLRRLHGRGDERGRKRRGLRRGRLGGRRDRSRGECEGRVRVRDRHQREVVAERIVDAAAA